MTRPAPRISLVGTTGLLFDPSDGPFQDSIQERLWAMADEISHVPGVEETVPGMNNCLITFDPLRLSHAAASSLLTGLWATAQPRAVTGKLVEIPTLYGGAQGEDLALWAGHCGLSAEEVVRRHAAAEYRVAAVGSMPGFAYLSGLDPALTMARRQSPRPRVAKGAVIIGGSQAGVMPMQAPSGWHIIGHCALELLDLSQTPPALLAPGDRVRFAIAGFSG